MTKKKIFCILLVILLVISGSFIAYKFIQHEKAQNYRLSTLETSIQGNIAHFMEKQRQKEEYYEYDTAYKDDAYNYLAIGNSLTLIPSWGRGICSTRPDNDYFHLVVKHLESQYGTVVAYPYNMSPWERSNDRHSCLDLIDVYLSDKLNLVTIQLGENVTDQTTYEKDLEKLIDYVRQKAPKAQIIIIGDFWDKKKSAQRQQAAQNTHCAFVDLSEIINNKNYQSYEGQECLLPDGSTIQVSHAAATHPGDKGMEYIANAVITAINK